MRFRLKTILPQIGVTHAITLIALLAPALLRVWLQFNMYAMYSYVGTGLEINTSLIVRGIASILTGIVLFMTVAEKDFKLPAAYISCGFLTASSIIFFIRTWVEQNPILVISSQASAIIGLIGFGIVWMGKYTSMPVRIVYISIIGSFGTGSLLGFLIGLLPTEIIGVSMLFLPAIILAAFIHINRNCLPVSTEEAGLPVLDAAKQQVFRLFTKTFGLTVLAMILFVFGLGIAIEYPFSDSVKTTLGYTAAHQLTVVVFCMVLLYAIFMGRVIRMRHLWIGEIILTVLGLSFYMINNQAFVMTGTLCLTVSRTFAIGLVTLFSYEIYISIRDKNKNAYKSLPAIFSFVYGCYLTSCSIGGRLGLILGDQSSNLALLVALIAGLLIVSLAITVCSPQESHPVIHLIQPVPAEQKTDEPVLMPNNTAQKSITTNEVLMQQYGLTEREAEIALLVGTGRSSAFIADLLSISENTVRNHSRNIYAKMDIHSKQELIDIVQMH
ncbi:MAG: helix-turn-helix transcriptional regulator [Coriobacteriales bacterium]|nr:helix-turn-helix transcriptional regulator [Coriobacteriales bacterium]